MMDLPRKFDHELPHTDPTLMTVIAMNLHYQTQNPRSILRMPSAKEILADLDDLMDEIGISKQDQEGMKLWAELESY
jgi:hypothetical protein